MKIVMKRVDELEEYGNNPRNNDDAVEKVAQSISEFGFINPIAVDANNVIIAGHTRLKAAMLLNMVQVPCIVHELDDDSSRIARIAENRARDFSTWDLGKLLDTIRSVQIPVKDAFFAPSARDRRFFNENKLMIFGSVELELTSEDEEMFERHFEAYIDEHKSHLGFVNHMVGGRTGA